MIKIKNKEYTDYNTIITWGKFTINTRGKERTGIAPFLTFDLKDHKYIGLELTFSDTMIKEMQQNIQIDIHDYISDILYKDENGWISIINNDYQCKMMRISEKIYRIIFTLSDEIEINTEIEFIISNK